VRKTASTTKERERAKAALAKLADQSKVAFTSREIELLAIEATRRGEYR
jgi:hypothetical protein